MFASIYVTIGATVAVFIGRVTVVAAGVNGAITVSTTAKSGTIPAASAGAHTITCKVGGYWKGPNAAVGFPFGFITAALTDSGGDYPRVNFLNTATYSITAAMTHGNAGPVYFQGASVTPGDLGRFTIDCGSPGTSIIPLTFSSSQFVLRDCIVQNNGTGGAASNGIVISGASGMLERVTAANIRGNGFSTNQGPIAIECEAYNCNTAGSANLGGFSSSFNAIRCISHDHSGANGNGFVSLANMVDCIADTCAGVGVLYAAASTYRVERGAIYNSGSEGIKLNAAGVVTVENTILANNGTYGANNASTGILRLINNAYYLNTSNPTNGVTDETGAITCSAQPMTDPANGDFSLNNTAGGGASCRNAGRGRFTQNAGSYSKTTTAFPDVGAVQHQDAGGTSVIVVNQTINKIIINEGDY